VRRLIGYKKGRAPGKSFWVLNYPDVLWHKYLGTSKLKLRGEGRKTKAAWERILLRHLSIEISTNLSGKRKKG